MSKRAEQATKEIYKDGIELFGRRDRNGNLIIHPETMVGILRNACQKGYEQAEKDTIERVISWVRKNTYIYTDTQNDEEGNLMIAFLEEAFIDDIKKAMDEEQ